MKTGVEMRASGNAAGSLGIASIEDEATGICSRLSSTMSLLLLASRSPSFLVSVVAIVQKYPICYRLSLLRERSPPAAGQRAPPPRESFRRRLVNVSIAARPRRSAGLGYV
jgi:hypothetical protein